MERRVTRLEAAVFGWTESGAGGLIEARASDRKRLEVVEQSLLQARTVIRAARWMILGAAALVTASNADSLAGGLAAALRVLAASIKG